MAIPFSILDAAAVIFMEEPEKHSGKNYSFSAEALIPHQAETLTAATSHKLTAAVRDTESFLNDVA